MRAHSARRTAPAMMRLTSMRKVPPASRAHRHRGSPRTAAWRGRVPMPIHDTPVMCPSVTRSQRCRRRARTRPAAPLWVKPSAARWMHSCCNWRSPRGSATAARIALSKPVSWQRWWTRSACLDRSLRSTILGGMGVTTWFFLRPRPGELRPLALSKVEDFFFRAGRLPVDEEAWWGYKRAGRGTPNR